ncbi:hypothetical protein SAMN04488065_1097 [Haloplanus vescus]|uniref:DUF7312 domain-containing protein n=1 Tax=Haloplanus vescus TaxID=555874 RepID=A0A1H3WSL1_9EURY|nr:hypothetical protein [Haloplanus vescus]SDZ89950.1 hypothetical protein SAMN04488065_1097 [Haloplanus vescus]
MSALSDDDRDDDESPWRFALDEVGEDADDPAAIEPESPELENVVFVLLGVALSVGIFAAALGGL